MPYVLNEEHAPRQACWRGQPRGGSQKKIMAGKHRFKSGSSVTTGDGTDIAPAASASKTGTPAVVEQQQSLERERATALLDELAGLLEREGNSLPGQRGIRHSIAAARKELTKQSPQWNRVSKSLQKIAAGVAPVTALADSVRGIQAFIARIRT